MSDQKNRQTDSSPALVYQIRLKGHLSSQWTGWFGGLAVDREENGETLLTGPVTDQAALHGLLRKVRDLGLPLLAVAVVQPSLLDGPAEVVPDADQ